MAQYVMRTYDIVLTDSHGAVEETHGGVLGPTQAAARVRRVLEEQGGGYSLYPELAPKGQPVGPPSLYELTAEIGDLEPGGSVRWEAQGDRAVTVTCRQDRPARR